MFSAQQRAAYLRSLLQAIGSALFVALMTWATTDEPKVIIIAASTAALTALGIRGGVEGAYDAKRQRRGAVTPADVGQDSLAVITRRDNGK